LERRGAAQRFTAVIEGKEKKLISAKKLNVCSG
jgi:hypothetical protein